MNELAGKTCVITGGAGSIGMASARAMRTEGARLVLVDLDQDRLDQAAAEAFGAGAEDVMCLAADVSSEDQTAGYIAQATDRFGSIDVLFSNAGNFGVVAPIQSYPTDQFDQVYATHVRGAFLASKYAVPHMGEGGSIIMTSSVAATRGDPGVYAYITAKHALTGLMRVMSKELAPRGIRVNAIAPGPVSNDFQQRVEDGLGAEIGRDGTEFFNELIPMGRHATADEIAQSVLFLATPRSAFTTGHLMLADGGMSV